MGVAQETSNSRRFLNRITTRIKKAESKDSGEESHLRSGMVFSVGGEEFNLDSQPRRASNPELSAGERSPSPQHDVPDLVLAGWLSRRGDHIHTWKRRYFELRSDRSLREYKTKPTEIMARPVHHINVADCRVLELEKSRPHAFMIRKNGASHSRSDHSSQHRVRSRHSESGYELMLCAQSNSERVSWLESIKNLSEEICHSLGSTPKKQTLEDFEFLKLIGKGSFGKVILCREKDSDQLVALKILRKSVVIEKEEVTHTLTENKVLQGTKHPFLIGLCTSFQTINRLCFVMEYVNGGDLYFHLSHDRVFTEERAKFYGAEIVLALGYLHRNKIVYRDVKLENVLLDREGHVKIADFGLCKDNMAFGDVTKTFCGTPEYLAPEVCAIYVERTVVSNDYGRAVDWWGTGVVMYEMMCGRLPFYNNIPELLFQQIMTQDVRFPSNLSRKAVSLLVSLMDKDPDFRLGGDASDVEEVKSHPYFSDVNWTDLYNKEVTPPFRPQVESDLDTRYFDETFTAEPVILNPHDDDTDSMSYQDDLFKDFSCCEKFDELSESVMKHAVQEFGKLG